MKKTTKEKLIIGAFQFANGMTYKDIAAYASSTAFFFFIAIIPLLILLSKLLPLTGITDDQLVSIITKFTPEFTDLMVVLIIKEAYKSSLGVVSISAAVLLYATARGMLALLRGLNRIYEVEQKRSGIIMMVRAIIYTLIMVMELVLLLLLIVFGETIMRFLIERVNILDKRPIIFSFRYILALTVGTISFMLLYTYLPGERQPFRKQFTGAAFATIAWVIFSYFFSLFITSSIYGTYYGSLAAVVVFMMWLYGCFYILLIGAQINYSLSSAGISIPRRNDTAELKK